MSRGFMRQYLAGDLNPGTADNQKKNPASLTFFSKKVSEKLVINFMQPYTLLFTHPGPQNI